MKVGFENYNDWRLDMKSTIITLAMLFLISAISFAGDTITRDFDVKPGQELFVDVNTGGSIYIKGWDQDKVLVRVEIDGRDWENVDVEFKETKSGIEIYSEFIRKRRNSRVDIEFEIRTPKKFDLDLKTNGGEIEIENIEGEIYGKTMGGSLDLENLKGDIELTTMGGNIDGSQLDGQLYLKTMGGNVRLSDSKADGKVITMGGNIRLAGVDGDIESSTMGGNVIYGDAALSGKSNVNEVVQISTKGGNIHVDDAPAGADVRTLGGDITIKSAGKFVKAKTNGGDIEIVEVDGAVDAVTNGGDVTVRMTGDPSEGNRDVEISSNGGDIELVLPEGISAVFDIELAVTKRHHDDCKIISDFDIKVEESDDWDYFHGTPRKHTYGTGSVNGGENKIHIETINGDIKIIKGK